MILFGQANDTPADDRAMWITLPFDGEFTVVNSHTYLKRVSGSGRAETVVGEGAAITSISGSGRGQ